MDREHDSLVFKGTLTLSMVLLGAGVSLTEPADWSLGHGLVGEAEWREVFPEISESQGVSDR